MRVLVVDDRPDTVASLVACLLLEGCEAEGVQSPGEALGVASARPPDAVVADEVMPEMSGHEMIRRLREMGIIAPVALLSGLPPAELAEAVVGLGEVRCFLKPASPEVFLAWLTGRVRVQKGGAV